MNNDLGQPTRAGNFTIGVTYHPNGTLAGLTNGNGIVRWQTLNTRLLPLCRRDTYDSTVFQDLTYAYDKNGDGACR